MRPGFAIGAPTLTIPPGGPGLEELLRLKEYAGLVLLGRKGNNVLIVDGPIYPKSRKLLIFTKYCGYVLDASVMVFEKRVMPFGVNPGKLAPSIPLGQRQVGWRLISADGRRNRTKRCVQLSYYYR